MCENPAALEDRLLRTAYQVLLDPVSVRPYLLVHRWLSFQILRGHRMQALSYLMRALITSREPHDHDLIYTLLLLKISKQYPM